MLQDEEPTKLDARLAAVVAAAEEAESLDAEVKSLEDALPPAKAARNEACAVLADHILATLEQGDADELLDRADIARALGWTLTQDKRRRNSWSCGKLDKLLAWRKRTPSGSTFGQAPGPWDDERPPADKTARAALSGGRKMVRQAPAALYEEALVHPDATHAAFQADPKLQERFLREFFPEVADEAVRIRRQRDEQVAWDARALSPEELARREVLRAEYRRLREAGFDTANAFSHAVQVAWHPEDTRPTTFDALAALRAVREPKADLGEAAREKGERRNAEQRLRGEQRRAYLESPAGTMELGLQNLFMGDFEQAELFITTEAITQLTPNEKAEWLPKLIKRLEEIQRPVEALLDACRAGLADLEVELVQAAE